MKYIKSCLNYTGGKYKLLPQIVPLIPRDINTFIDLFCGGCNVGLNIESKSVIFNDSLQQVIEMYEILHELDYGDIITRVEEIIEKYKLSYTFKNDYSYYKCNSSEGLSKYNRDGYLKLRSDYNSLINTKEKLNKQKQSLYLYVLSIYGFNNQIRFNNKGEYNIPVGKRDFNKKSIENLKLFKEKLKEKNTIFLNSDFRKLRFDTLDYNDFVYIDPPYLITTATYNENKGWTIDDEIDLLNLLDQLNGRGVRFALSNVLSSKGFDNEILIEWSSQYKVNYLNYSYSNSNYQIKDKENKSIEVLITNY